jgi:hypothetical protein
MLGHNTHFGRPHRYPRTQLRQAFRQAKHNEALVPDVIFVKAWAYTEIASPNLSQSLQRREFVNETVISLETESCATARRLSGNETAQFVQIRD